MGANIKQGDTVLVHGATGVSGKLAVQIAKLLGAGRVVGTGRNEASLKRVMELGADAVINLKQSEETLVEAFKKEAKEGIDIALDFLWGKPTELFMRAFIPAEIGYVGKRTCLVQIGEAAGASIALPANALRNSGLEIIGASAGMTADAMSKSTNQVWTWIKDNKLQMDIEEIPLKEIESVWKRTNFAGKRMVIVM